MHMGETWLINGSMGSVVDIVWSANADVVKELPSALMVRFDAYTGPVLFDDGDGKPAVLIFPVRRDFGPINWIPDEDRDAGQRYLPWEMAVLRALLIMRHYSERNRITRGR